MKQKNTQIIRKAVIPAAAPVPGFLRLEAYGHAAEEHRYGVALSLIPC